ncbi:MAG: response regulator [candidate division KSB1 bacterium]|nr:response regulator [candidate division KSB1 bacterium]MDZ7334522.1 response regulator [candidate division KSB1 bacterium]MDZ7356969.1 response regulator [candidate division KSB1 bacterium]MDZ7376119.1 response regulator [candidate division KSB1 bacterium]MDZ7400969.1 response regulator [candidate division KSB1 bacterium]
MADKIKILLVDNDVDFVDLNKAVLENSGFEVVTAFSGREGIDKVKVEHPDLIVLDLMMEKHDAGFSFAKQIKADPIFKRIPILMLTSVAEVTGFGFSQELDGYWMKTDDYAEKPIMPDELVRRVRALLEKSKEKEQPR